MASVVNFDDKKLKKNKWDPAKEQSQLKKLPTNADRKFNQAFWLFSECSSLGKKRHENFSMKYCAGTASSIGPSALKK